MSEDRARVVIVEQYPPGAVSWNRFPAEPDETAGWAGVDPSERYGGVDASVTRGQVEALLTGRTLAIDIRGLVCFMRLAGDTASPH